MRTRDARTPEGVPVTFFTANSADSGPAQAAVIVAHGFSGNRQLMYAFGYALARNGYTAVLIDFAGHGANAKRMPNDFSETQYRALAANLDSARQFVASQPLIDPERIALLGHSMGAGTVTRYASEHPDVPLTLALSLGDSGSTLPERADVPRNLLVLVGSLEMSGFIDGSSAALQRAYPGGAAGVTYGTHAGGTARRLVLIQNVEHITILFSEDTQREVVRWLDAGFAPGSVVRPAPATDARMIWLLLLYVAGVLGFYPLTAWLFRAQPAPILPSAATRDTWRAIGISLGATVLALFALLVAPYTWLPLTVGNYVGHFFLLHGLITLLVARMLRRPLMRPALNLRMLFSTAAATFYALIVFNAPAHVVWNNGVLSGDRAWIGAFLFVCCFVFFLAHEWLTLQVKQRGWHAFAMGAFVVTGLFAAVIWLSAPGFLMLIVPLLPVLLLWQAVYALWLRRLTGAAWVAATVNGAMFAWMMAATFALVD